MTRRTKISPRYTVGDWADLGPRLEDPFDQNAWLQACDIARDRIENRFLLPAKVLMEHPNSTGHGFGFAMMALDCLLIDALQAFLRKNER